MSDTYLIPQFIIDYLQKSKSTKNPQKLAPASLKKNKTPEIEKWFEENEVTASYIWKFFVFYGLDRFSFRECLVCGKRINLNAISYNPDAKYCSTKCANSSEEKKEKRKQTCLERYGVEHSFQNTEVQEKIKQTCRERYGVEHPFQNKVVQEKFKQTCKEKYGVENPQRAEEIKEKHKQTRRSNYWETFCSLLKEKNIVPLFSKEEYKNDTGRKFKCLLCGEEFKSEGTYTYKKEHKNQNGTYTTLQAHNIYCPHCINVYSKKEKEVFEFVKSIYNGEILENHKGLFPNKKMELDIYLPSLSLGIEFDGDYWHSLKNVQERDATKTKLCEEKGIKLLRIREEDWDNNRQSVKEKIKEFLGIK